MNAVEVAISLTSLYDADLVLYGQIDSETAAIESKGGKSVKEKLDDLEKGFDFKDLDLIKEIGIGDFIETLDEYINENNVDLLVIGAHGTGPDNTFLGTNAVKLMRKVACPTIIVKNRVENFALNKVVFVSNFNMSNLKPFKQLVKMILPFNSEIHLLKIETPTFFRELDLVVKPVMDIFQKYAEEHGSICHAYRHNHMLIEQGVDAFIKKVDPDLVAIATHERSYLQRLFVSSVAEALANHVGLPTMTIKIKE